MHCPLQAELWPGPANPKEQVGGCATAQHSWLPLVLGEVVYCFSLPTASPIASLGGTGTEPCGLWWNPRPSRPFHTASCCGQCSFPVEKACSSGSYPGGLSQDLGCPCSPVARSCILSKPRCECKQNPLHILHPLNPLYGQGMDRERFLFSKHTVPMSCSWNTRVHALAWSSRWPPGRTLLHSLGSCHGRRHHCHSLLLLLSHTAVLGTSEQNEPILPVTSPWSVLCPVNVSGAKQTNSNLGQADIEELRTEHVAFDHHSRLTIIHSCVI